MTRVVRVELGGAESSPDSSRAYDITLGPGAAARAAPAAWRARADGAERDVVAVLADRAVFALHRARLALECEALVAAPRFERVGGETAKSLTALGETLEFLADARCSRRSCLVVIGGGSLGDLGGLAASLFKRGLDVVQVPTTLLAQVDASVGGKTAINLAAGKNLAGTFHQPLAVCADTEFLRTLPEVELRSGLGEVVKAALIGGDDDLARLEARASDLARGGTEAASDGWTELLTDVVADAVAVKARVVAADPLERGPRRALNLGHTFAHALERCAGYGVLPHGEAVAAGIGLALAASARTGVLEDAQLPARYAALARALGLAADLRTLCARYAIDPHAEALVAALAHDKKGAVGAPEFVLVRRAGDLALGVPLATPLLLELITP